MLGTALACICCSVVSFVGTIISLQMENASEYTFSLYSELMESLNSVLLLVVVLVFSFGILFYIFYRNRTNKVKEIVGEEQFNKLFKFKKVLSRYQKLVNETGHGTVFIIKLNNFEFLNELYGSVNIEEYILAVSQKLSENIRGGYYYGRISLSEFIVYTAEKKPQKEVADYTVEIFNLIKAPITIKDIRLTSNFNIGIASMEGQGSIHKELMRRAVLAMWYSKRQGENFYSVYSTEIDEKFIKEDEIKKEMGRALDNNEFELYYQPIYNSCDGSVYGIEALIRWNHPEKGMLKPDYFIVEAEKNNMIIEIGYWVIERAFRDFNKILNSFTSGEAKNIRLSVNVSPSQLEDKNFFDTLEKYILEYNMNPENVVLEITEQVYIQETLRVNELLRSIKELGCKIAFDDFGIQYSTLSKLNDLNFDVVKIDRKFILGIPNDLVCIEIIRMLVSLTAITGKQLVAEGVDSLDQLEKLKEYGCNTIQGFYYSQAVDILSLIQKIHSSLAGKNDGTMVEKLVESPEEHFKSDESEAVYNRFFFGCPMPVTLNKLIAKGENTYDIVLSKINESYKKEFCISGELVEGKTSEKVYPDLNNIRINRIADAMCDNRTIRFPMYYCKNSKKVYDLTIMPAGSDMFAMIFSKESASSEIQNNLLKVKAVYEETSGLLDVALHLGQTDIWEYDIAKRELKINWHSVETGRKTEKFAIEDYFEMIYPEDKKIFREKFLSYMLENINKPYDKNNIFIIDYRLKLPWVNQWTWTKTSFHISSYKGRTPLTAVAVNINIERYKEYEKEIEFQLCHDTLTNLLNRRGLAQELPSILAKNKPHAVCIMDLDNFRKTNEKRGHEYGNKILSDISLKINDALPADSIAARLSGDEFLVCFPYENDKQLKNICKKILKKIKFTDEFGINYSASMGVALFPVNSRSQSDLMSMADMELDKVKSSKKGDYSVYQEN